jgi:oxalate decarboxylase
MKMGKNNLANPTGFFLHPKKSITPTEIKDAGWAYVVDKEKFSALSGITSYCLEIWGECMRLPHWHPNASELGYVISGEIEVIIWRSSGETASFTLTAGMCWFIPKAALHSLNNIGKEKARLLVGFSAEIPQDIDLPVAFNGIPIPVRNALTSPHVELSQWSGVNINPLLGKLPRYSPLEKVLSASPYGFDLKATPPLFDDKELGSVIWGVKSNWNILQEISVLRAILKPGVARDPIWYPDVSTLYVVAKGQADFSLVMSGYQNTPVTVGVHDYVFVPMGVLHTFINTSDEEDFEVIAFFTNENPLPEVSLSVSTSFFPDRIRRAAMTQYGTENKSGDPLEHLDFPYRSPYLLSVKDKS